MVEVLDHPPAMAEQVLACDTRLTQRWSHGELHDTLPALDSHVIVAFYGSGSREIVWRTDGRRVAGRTRAGTMTVIPQGHDGR